MCSSSRQLKASSKSPSRQNETLRYATTVGAHFNRITAQQKDVLDVVGFGVEPELDLGAVPLLTEWPDARVENSTVEAAAVIARFTGDLSPVLTFLVSVTAFTFLVSVPVPMFLISVPVLTLFVSVPVPTFLVSVPVLTFFVTVPVITFAFPGPALTFLVSVPVLAFLVSVPVLTFFVLVPVFTFLVSVLVFMFLVAVKEFDRVARAHAVFGAGATVCLRAIAIRVLMFAEQ
jgi:hypothetical protein